MSVRGATAIGFVAVLLWSQLAALTTLSGTVPPFQLVAMSFAVASLIGVLWALASGLSLTRALAAPPGAFLLGVAGLCGYHFFYFLALRSAPAVEANLINYLWPLLIVLFSAFLKETGGLRWHHVAGALLGLAGTAVILVRGTPPAFGGAAFTGYAAAAAAAILWSAYSVLSRRYARVSSVTVTGYCLITACVAALAHLAFEETRWPESPLEWGAVLGLGLGPVGAAFYVWDYGVKHGDIRVLGAAAYLAPLLSTLSLVLFGLGTATPALWAACTLITGGAILAARDMFAPPPPSAGR
ncbi:MAG: DMT family transporter [Alphaproteobacteria bacterium]|nr:MAG: DMT family transporter [Alphaproteobacteria bacterium]